MDFFDGDWSPLFKGGFSALKKALKKIWPARSDPYGHPDPNAQNQNMLPFGGTNNGIVVENTAELLDVDIFPHPNPAALARRLASERTTTTQTSAATATGYIAPPIPPRGPRRQSNLRNTPRNRLCSVQNKIRSSISRPPETVYWGDFFKHWRLKRKLRKLGRVDKRGLPNQADHPVCDPIKSTDPKFELLNRGKVDRPEQPKESDDSDNLPSPPSDFNAEEVREGLQKMYQEAIAGISYASEDV